MFAAPKMRVLSLPGGKMVPARQTAKMLGMRNGLVARGRALSGTKDGNIAVRKDPREFADTQIPDPKRYPNLRRWIANMWSEIF